MRKIDSMTPTPPPPSALQHSKAAPDVLLSMVFRSVGVLAVLAVPLVSGLGAADGAPFVERGPAQQQPVWETAYSEQFPGCVASVLWPAKEEPVAVVVRTPEGDVERVTLDARGQSLQQVAPGTATIGACR